MNKFSRVLIALALLTVILALGMQGTAWANTLSVVNQAPAVNIQGQGVLAGNRAQGTVHTGNPNVTLTAGVTSVVGSCSTVLLNETIPNATYVASRVESNEFTKSYPGKLISCLLKIRLVPANNKTLGADFMVCFPITPSTVATADYWNGTQWIASTLPSSNGLLCVIVPATAPNPLYAAMFSKQ